MVRRVEVGVDILMPVRSAIENSGVFSVETTYEYSVDAFEVYKGRRLRKYCVIHSTADQPDVVYGKRARIPNN